MSIFNGRQRVNAMILLSSCSICFIEKGRVMIWTTLKTAKGKKFLLCLLGVFVIAASIVTRATIGGVIEQYNIPLSEWTTSMYFIQSSMIFVYSLVFTVLLAIPLGIYLLGGEDKA
ncbi:conserved hypothetical protein; putative exported protein [Escherichia fergusonii ATCC 35469]|uniref:DUF2534 family protein n=2 Tax=Escherichia fergusonii TaxID=564 RepID=B7LRW9_ESCF3|nr:conserved hypothetical protein; putative exported protein [Escherichia fergusonii ATCC 35469]